jgi:hypothetical protein
MSQNSLVLPTTGTVSGLQMTQDINNALDTLNTLGSGLTAPSSPESGQLWHDTTTNAVKLRDQANANWITLGNIDETNKLWLPPLGGGTATLASAYTVNLGSVAQTSIIISGTTAITSFGTSMLPGQCKLVTFGGALTLTYNATSMLLPGGSNITTAAGDQAFVQCVSSGNYQLLYQPVSGKAVISASTVPYFAAAGCLPSAMSGTNTTAAITVSAGQVADSSGNVLMSCAGYTWAVTNGNAINGTDAASSTLANSTTYHMFLCSGSSGTGVYASASLTPTFPSGYTAYHRRIFSFNTYTNGSPVTYTAVETEGGSYLAWLNSQILDISFSGQSTSRIAYTLTVPAGIRVQPLGRSSNNSASNVVIYTSGDETDVAPTTVSNQNFGSSPGFDIGGSSSASTLTWGGGILTTNTSGQIGARASASSVDINWVTRGFKDWRRS